MNRIRACLLTGLIWGAIVAQVAQAQIVPDSTLGGERSTIVPRRSGGDQITGGAIRGINLFHSFSDFNIGIGQQVYFTNPTGVQNILTRVTGSNGSSINGRLGVDGTANLFLLNPNGIVFGKDARLDVRGSFLATTANTISFGNQGSFSATDRSAPPLLTIQPSALTFTQLQPSAIESRATLAVKPEQSLKLIAGAVTLEDSALIARSGRVELGSVNAPATVRLDQPLVIPANVARSDVTLTGSELDVRGNTAGNIAIAANNITASKGTAIRNGAIGQSQIVNQSGDVNLNATGFIRFTDGSYIDSRVYRDAIANSGNIRIEAGTLWIEDGQFALATTGTGKVGDLSIQVRDRVLLDNSSSLLNRIDETGSGQSGNIEINASSLTLKNGSQIDTSSFGKGQGGNIVIRVRDQLRLEGNDSNQSANSNPLSLRTAIFSQITPTATTPKAGDIDIEAGSVLLSDGAIVKSNTTTLGDAGRISIRAKDSVLLDGDNTTIFSGATSGGKGNGNDIAISTGRLQLTNGASLESTMFGTGNAKNIVIQADSVDLNNGSILSRLGSSGIGNGGNIEITTRNLQLEGAGVVSSTFGQGNGGNISIRAANQVSLTNSIIGSEVGSTAKGQGGNVVVNTASLALQTGSELSTAVFGQGNAGKITVQAIDGISIVDRSSIGSLVWDGVGNAGDIDITARSLFLTGKSTIDASTLAQGNSGNISVRTQDGIALSGEKTAIINLVDAGAKGNGGNIDITARSLFLTDKATLDASTRSDGNAGNISVQVLDGVTLSGNETAMTSKVEQGARGNGGNITITARSLKIANGAQILTDLAEDLNSNPAKAGDVRINAADLVEISGNPSEGTGISTGAISFLSGSGGSININADRIQLVNGSLNVFTASGFEANGGSIAINTREFEAVDSFINTLVIGVKQPGAISIRADEQATFVKTSVSASAFSDPLPVIDVPTINRAGNIEITAPVIKLDRQALIESGSLGFSTDVQPISGGNIQINASSALILRHGSQIQTNVTGDSDGNGGNIKINARFVIAPSSEGSNITANAITGQGGNIAINTQGLFGIEPRSRIIPGVSSITASSDLGVQGNVSIAQPDIQPTQGTTELPTTPIPGNQVSQSCPRGRDAARSLGSFVVSGHGSAPRNPINALDGSAPISQLATLDESPENRSTVNPTSKPELTIVEAQGWIKTPEGKVVLVAHTPETMPPIVATCPTISP